MSAGGLEILGAVGAAVGLAGQVIATIHWLTKGVEDWKSKYTDLYDLYAMSTALKSCLDETDRMARNDAFVAVLEKDTGRRHALAMTIEACNNVLNRAHQALGTLAQSARSNKLKQLGKSFEAFLRTDANKDLIQRISQYENLLHVKRVEILNLIPGLDPTREEQRLREERQAAYKSRLQSEIEERKRKHPRYAGRDSSGSA